MALELSSDDRPTLPAPPCPRDPESGVRLAAEASAEQAEKRRFGSLRRVPRLAVPLDILRDMKLDAASGFLLSHVDGATSIEDVLDVCAMPHVQALRLLGALAFLGVIDLEDPPRR